MTVKSCELRKDDEFDMDKAPFRVPSNEQKEEGLTPKGTAERSVVVSPMVHLEKEMLRWKILEWMRIDPTCERLWMADGWVLDLLLEEVKREALSRVMEAMNRTHSFLVISSLISYSLWSTL